MNQLFLIGFVTLFTALTAWSGEAEFDYKKLMKSMTQMNEQVMKVKSWRDTEALGYSIDDYFKMAKTAAGYETLDSTFPSINNESLRTIEKLREAAIAEGEDSATFLMWENDMLYIMLSDNFLTAYRDKPNFIKLYLEYH